MPERRDPYPYVLTPEWLTMVEQKKWTAFLHMEAHYIDAWGEAQVISFKLSYRASDGLWRDHKDPKDTEGEIEIS